jgi:hypothetical protein
LPPLLPFLLAPLLPMPRGAPPLLLPFEGGTTGCGALLGILLGTLLLGTLLLGTLLLGTLLLGTLLLGTLLLGPLLRTDAAAALLTLGAACRGGVPGLNAPAPGLLLLATLPAALLLLLLYMSALSRLSKSQVDSLELREATPWLSSCSSLF